MVADIKVIIVVVVDRYNLLSIYKKQLLEFNGSNNCFTICYLSNNLLSTNLYNTDTNPHFFIQDDIPNI